tara:strand:- start:504 stop:2771 length:2268 start_codon:yes stop_codon:yes gene_type:complete
MKNLKNQANQVANAGRFGDSMLVHMNPMEVQGLANTMPMTVNPQTGQPEMFLPFLAPLLGSAAGTALFSGIMSPAVAGAVGSGLATAIAEGDLKKGIMAGITGFGIGNVLGQVGAGTKGAVDQATTEAIKQAATQEGSAAALNPLVTQTLADEAGKVAAENAMQGFKDATIGERVGMIGENLFSGDTLSTLAQPASYVPIAVGEGQRGVMEAQEQFEEDMRKFEQDEEERKRRLYAMNPEQIPFSSPYYGAEGGVVAMQEGGEIFDNEIFGNPDVAPVFPTAPTMGNPVTLPNQMPYAPAGVTMPMPIANPNPMPMLPTDTSFESAISGEQDFAYTPVPQFRPSSDIAPRGREVLRENMNTGEFERTGQFRPPSSYRPGIDAEFNYFPYSNRPASFISPVNSFPFRGGINIGIDLGGGGESFSQIMNDINQPDFNVDDYITTSPINPIVPNPINPIVPNIPEIPMSPIDFAPINPINFDSVMPTNPIDFNIPNIPMMPSMPMMPDVTPFIPSNTNINPLVESDVMDFNIQGGSGAGSPDQRLDLSLATDDFLRDMEIENRMLKAKGRQIDDATRGMAIHEMDEGKTIPEDAKGLQALAKEKPSVVRSMGYEVDMQSGGVTVMPEDLDMVQKAILGQIPNNTEVIAMFIDKYGNEIFMQIREQVLNPMGSMQTQGMIEGMGGGMDDQVMGMIGTQQPVAVSPGEYIIPADVVSGLGDGSSDAGSKELDKMLDRVRQERTNTTKQPKELNKGKVLPI